MVLEEKVRSKMYGASHVKTMLTFETESVPVQQFQARVAQLVLQHGGRGLLAAEADFESVINLALRVSILPFFAESLGMHGADLQTLHMLPSMPDVFIGGLSCQ